MSTLSADRTHYFIHFVNVLCFFFFFFVEQTVWRILCVCIIIIHKAIAKWIYPAIRILFRMFSIEFWKRLTHTYTDVTHWDTYLHFHQPSATHTRAQTHVLYTYNVFLYTQMSARSTINVSDLFAARCFRISNIYINAVFILPYTYLIQRWQMHLFLFSTISQSFDTIHSDVRIARIEFLATTHEFIRI